MANVIHRTTLQYLPSVSTPDFPEPTWKHAPNMSGVAGVPSKYWKAPSDWAGDVGPVEMSAGEKAGVDAAELKASDMASKWVQVMKPSHETRTATTTLANDTDLKGNTQPSAKYAFRARIFFDTTAAGDFKFGIAGPASPAGVRIARRAIAAGATAFSAIAVDTAFGGSVAVTGTGTNGGFVELDGEFETGVNGGLVAFQWAQNTSDGGNTRVLAGSYFEFQRIG